MGERTTITTDDGTFAAYVARPSRSPAPAIVVIQEIFGVNHHIREVCDNFARQGYAVVAPALFDRVERGVELGYAPDDVAVGRELRAKVPEDGTIADVEAAARALGGVPLGIVGYCWGGTVAWWGATRSRSFKAAVGWYGGGIAATRTEHPHCPVQLHFGEQDQSIPLSDVDAIRQAQPEVEVFVYEGAGHGFGCTERASFKRDARDLAQERTLAFFQHYVK
jgi:carboxymethylenebutenolidase